MYRRTAVRSSFRTFGFTPDYPDRVMYSFRPRPEPTERQALLLALERLLSAEDEERPYAYRSEWRRAAFEEGVSPGDEDEPSR
jgi:hypothetical protein